MEPRLQRPPWDAECPPSVDVQNLFHPRLADAPRDPKAIFVCDEESEFYSSCVQQMVLSRQDQQNKTIIEFGSGDGSPILNGLQRQPFGGTIHGFELNPKAAALARRDAQQLSFHKTYQVHNSCFFEGVATIPASTLISNPPYIAAPDDDILMPALHGGTDGSNLTRDLMTLGYDSAMLLVCSYCDPVLTLRHAQRLGYMCTDFMVTALPFGRYSAEPKVKDWITGMRSEGRAFFSEHNYLLAGVLLQRQQASPRLQPDDDSSESASSDDDLSSTGVTDVAVDQTEELLAILMAA
jgi:hypothetical protein